MSEAKAELPGSVELRETQLAYEASRLNKSRASAKAGRVVPVTDLRDWVDSLETDHELPVPRARWGRPKLLPQIVILTDEAAEDVGNIRLWLRQRGSGPAAFKKLAAIVEAIENLAEMPLIGKRGDDPPTRELVSKGHRIIYEVTAHRIVVLAVFGPGQSGHRR
jgi:plasmid stabilization system protein ParE